MTVPRSERTIYPSFKDSQMIERYPRGDRAAWLSRRAPLLTASDIGAAFGVDTYKSPLSLWAEKSGLLLPVEDNASMQRGRWCECACAAGLRELYPDWRILYPLDQFLVDHEHRLGATPDCLAEIDGELVNIQIKVVARPEFTKHWSAGPPLAYELQTLCEGMLLEADRSLIAAFVLDTYNAEIELFDVPRHAAAESRLHDIAAAFWDSVNTGRRPPADVSRDAPVVAAMFPKSTAEPVLDLTGDNHLASLLPERALLKASIATFSERVEVIDGELKCKLGEAEKAVLPGWQVTWKTQSRRETVIPASSFRVLRVSRREEEDA